MPVDLYLTITTPLSADTFEVISVRGEEGISALFGYTVELGSHDLNVDFTAILGKPVTLHIACEDETKQHRNGIVARLGQRMNADAQIVYVAEVVPWLWLLTRTSDCRIFQNKSVPDIIKAIFSDLGQTAFKDSLTKSYTPREYCVQYAETHFDFVSRLMEDEGIYYFFTHEDGEHTLVLGDDLDIHVPCPGLAKAVHFKRFGASWTEEDAINACTLEEQVVLREYKMDDYNFETPSTDLLVSVDGTTPDVAGKLSMYEYPGGFMKKDEGEKRARNRIEIHELQMKTVRGASNCRDFVAGGKFTMKGHYRESMNGDYVLGSVQLDITQERYHNTFAAFPAAVQFRPPLATPKPAIHGYQLATVVGKSGEEIWTDQYGRVKVDFPWDTRSKSDENSSCWIRVAQTWAGKGWGTVATPRIGTEVLVSFLDGDPDRPIIIGTLYNAQQTVPYALPGEQTKTLIKSNSSKGGGGSNEIRLEDKKGSEQIFIHAEKDTDYYVKNDHRELIGNERHLIVKKDLLEEIDGDKHLTVKGNHNQKVDGTVSLNVSMNLQEKVGMNHAVDAGQEIHLKGGMNVVIEAGMSVTLKAGGGFVVVGPAGVAISGPLVQINSGGSAGAGAGASPEAPKAPREAAES
jgi:type VI secretion system secreted protein VgrG